MKVSISGHHLEVSPALHDHVSERIKKIKRHFESVVLEVKVVLSIENTKEAPQRAECTVHAKGQDFFAEASHQDLYTAIDMVVDKLNKQVLKYKERLTDHPHVKLETPE